MKKTSPALSYVRHGLSTEPDSFFFHLALSAVCHILFFGSLIFWPASVPKKRYSLPIIHVDMVSLPMTAETDTLHATKQVKNNEPIQPSDKNAPGRPKADGKAVSSAPPKIKQSLKKKTFKSRKVVQSAIARIEKKVETSTADSLTDVLKQLEERVQKGNNKDGQTPSNRSAKKTGPAGFTRSTGKDILDRLNIYRIEVAFQIQKRWAFSEQLAGSGSNLQASLVFKVMPDGEIKNIFFTDRSGNPYLDDSAYKAVLKSNPVSPHPKGINKPFVEIGLRFGPKGLK